MLDLLLETLLSFKTGVEQGGFVHVPLTDAFYVFRAVLIINDEWHDLVAQTLFEHEQPSKATIAIGQKVDALEMNIIV